MDFNVFSLSAGQVIALFFLGYLFFSFVVFCIDGFFRFLAWGFHKLLSRIAVTQPPPQLPDDLSANDFEVYYATTSPGHSDL